MLCNNIVEVQGGKNMKHHTSKIGEYGITWKPVEGYKRKDGKKVYPYMKKVEFKWKKSKSN